MANQRVITDEQWLANLNAVQKAHGIEPSTALEVMKLDDGAEVGAFPNFTVEMETGTGKTYVYLRTVYELSKTYGFKKFVIVVPSVAIREVEFLKALKAHLKQPLLIIRDGLKAHRSKLVREYLDGTDGHVQIAFLPPYSPGLNPVEYLWAWLKRHALANFCPDNLAELQTAARNKLKSAQHRPNTIAACWKQAGLF